MTDAHLMDADCVHGNTWWECQKCKELEGDLGYCPYYARHYNLPGHSPTAICAGLADCWQQGEPICVTGEPSEGWPSIVAAFGGE